MAGYNTNIASEFYVLSNLARMGLDAHLTLGNKKSVDIVVTLANQQYLTIDVKGVAKKMDWLLGDKEPDIRPNHFYVLVSYNNTIDDVNTVPDTWVIPSEKLKTITDLLAASKDGKTRFIRRSFVYKSPECKEFKEGWQRLRTG